MEQQTRASRSKIRGPAAKPIGQCPREHLFVDTVWVWQARGRPWGGRRRAWQSTSGRALDQWPGTAAQQWGQAAALWGSVACTPRCHLSLARALDQSARSWFLPADPGESRRDQQSGRAGGSSGSAVNLLFPPTGCRRLQGSASSDGLPPGKQYFWPNLVCMLKHWKKEILSSKSKKAARVGPAG